MSMRSRIRHPVRAGAVALMAWLCPADSTAQTPDVVPPRLIEDPGVSYPGRALEAGFYQRTEVLLILDLDETGAVARATVEAPRGRGFDEAALEAARRLRFEPARRAGVPAPARIRYRYVFEPPPCTLSGRVVDAASGEAIAGALLTLRGHGRVERTVLTAADGSWSLADLARGAARVRVESTGHLAQDASVALTPGRETRVLFRLEPRPAGRAAARDLAGATTGEPAIEVTVRGRRSEPTVSSYTRAEVRQIPGAFGDPFRAIESMPGVTPIVSGLPFFFVRGAPPGNIGYLLDGVRVPYLYHVGAGPSVVHPGIVESVDLHPGGYPARFGRFSGAIVSASATEPRTDRHGEGNLRLFDAGGMVESGFAGGRGTVLVGGRYSYTGALLSLAAPELQLHYHDFQARISYDLTPDDRVSVFSFGSYDLLGQRLGDTGLGDDVLDILFGSEFYRVDVRHDHRLGGGGSIRTAVTLGTDRTSAWLLVPGDRRNIVDRSIGARVELTRPFGSHVTLRAGADVVADAHRFDGPTYTDPDSPEAREFAASFPARTDVVTGAWTDLELDWAPGLQIAPGVRADLHRSGSASAVGVDPRIRARLDLGPAVRLVAASGVAHQLPSFMLPLPGLVPALGEGLQRSIQTSLGLELALGGDTTAGVTGFYNRFSRMTDAVGTSSGEGDPDVVGPRSRGWSWGAELVLRRSLTRRLGGFVSYTLSRSVRNLGGSFLSAFDRTHVASAALGAALGRGWRAGGRVAYYTGAPIQEADGGRIVPGAEDVEREPSFLRVDLRLEKRWSMGTAGWLSLVIEVMNATLQKEKFGDEEIGPVVIPSLGVEAGF
jgi:TonB family protein